MLALIQCKSIVCTTIRFAIYKKKLLCISWFSLHVLPAFFMALITAAAAAFVVVHCLARKFIDVLSLPVSHTDDAYTLRRYCVCVLNGPSSCVSLGPCGGKTTGQSRLCTFFENLGWKVNKKLNK